MKNKRMKKYAEAAVQGVLRKRCYENMQHIYRRTPLPLGGCFRIWLFLNKCVSVKRKKIKFILFAKYSLLQNVVCLTINFAILYKYFESSFFKSFQNFHPQYELQINVYLKKIFLSQ